MIHDGSITPSQEAPSKPDILRSSILRANTPVRALNGVAPHRRNGNPPPNGEPSVSGDGIREAVIRARHKPHRRQLPWSNAVHDAGNPGASVRSIARGLAISRNTVTKYLAAETPDPVETVVRSTRLVVC